MFFFRIKRTCRTVLGGFRQNHAGLKNMRPTELGGGWGRGGWEFI